MFPLTHIYCIKQLVDANKDHFLGAVFPDIVITGALTRKDTHYNGKEVLKKFGSGFGEGYYSHTVIDHYCDEHPLPREGYAFRKSKPLRKEVKEFGLNEFFAKVRAHNFIELAIEVLLVGKDKGLIDDFNSIQYREGLDDYFKIDVKKHLDKFLSTVPIPGPKMLEKFSNVFVIRDGLKVPHEKLQRVLDEAIDIVKNTYLDDLNKMIRKVKL